MALPNFSLKGKVAFVTGSRRGISRTLALAFAEAGADVAVCDVVADDGQLAEVAESIKKFGRRSLSLPLDVSNKTEVEKAVQHVKEQLGEINVFLNGAGVCYRYSALDTPEEEWDRQADVVLKGTFLCGQAVGKVMKEQKEGSIINIASDLAFYPETSMAGYCAVKAGVVMMTRVLAKELGGYGVRANCIAPGLTRTELSKELWQSAEIMKTFESCIPLQRIAEPEDMVGTAIFLASDAAAYITGNTILVNGGGI